MKKQLTITALLIVLLAAVLISLSCNGPTTPTNNTAAPSNNGGINSTAPSNTEESILVDEDPDCSGNSADKPAKIKDGIERNIRSHSNLRNQYDTAHNFHFQPVVDADGDVILYIWGKIYMKSKRDEFNNFHNAYKYYRKKGCVKKIVFGQPTEISPSTPNPNHTTSEIAFQFVACEDPNHLCNDGSCKDDCNGNLSISNKNVNMRPNTNTNPNSNTNSNTNTNSNANRKT